VQEERIRQWHNNQLRYHTVGIP